MLKTVIRWQFGWLSKHIRKVNIDSTSCCDSVGAVLDEEDDDAAQGGDVLSVTDVTVVVPSEAPRTKPLLC